MSIAEYERKRRAWKKEKGLCSECLTKVEPGFSRCARHIKLHRQRERRYIVNPHGKRLETWKNYDIKRRKFRRKNGLCTRCGAELMADMDDNKTKCLNCREGLNCNS